MPDPPLIRAITKDPVLSKVRGPASQPASLPAPGLSVVPKPSFWSNLSFLAPNSPFGPRALFVVFFFQSVEPLPPAPGMGCAAGCLHAGGCVAWLRVWGARRRHAPPTSTKSKTGQPHRLSDVSIPHIEVMAEPWDIASNLRRTVSCCVPAGQADC